MRRIAPIRLEYDPKILWFDPGELEIAKGDAVIVTTVRGLEFGVAASQVIEVEDEQVEALKTPLQPVERIASDEDFAQRDEMRRLSKEALPIFKELAAETNEDMRPVMVEYLFDGTKAVFLFESEDRTDFRELVRKLTNRLHVRVDMRQIGVRDEARIIGGLGHCGQELCCRRLGGEFNPVSIRMAKAQDLSLNPVQISGVCGRLMCCLRYEYDTYKDFKARAPKLNATIQTPEGEFKVCELDTPHETVVLRVDKNKKVRIPLSAFDQPEADAESQRPKSVGEAYYEYARNDTLSAILSSPMSTTERFTGEDKLAEKGVVRHNPVRKKEEPDAAGESEPRRRRRVRGDRTAADAKPASSKQAGKHARGEKQAHLKATEPETPSRRRRNRGARGNDAPVAKREKDAASASRQQERKRPERTERAERVERPKRERPATAQGTEGTGHRRTRRRSHKTGGTNNDGQ